MVVKRKPAATPDGVKVTRRTLSDYAQDQHNLNKGTVRGLALHEKSVDEFGAARSIVADKNGVILAGNKTADRLFDAGITDVIEVETDGTQLVVVKRSDLDIETERGRLYTLADNRVAQVSIDFDASELQALADQGISLLDYFFEDELLGLLGDVPSLDTLATKYGEPTGKEFWPFIRVQVSPETETRYKSLMSTLPGADDAEKFAALLVKIDV